MKIIGIDLGAYTGYALFQDSQYIESGIKTMTSKNWESIGMRHLRARQFFQDLVGKHKPDIVAFEAVKRFMSSNASLSYGGYLSQLLAVCEETSTEYTGYSPTEIKKFATGSGRAKKPEMISASHRYNSEVTDDNEADAILIAALAINELCRRKEESQSTSEVKTKRSTTKKSLKRIG